MLVVILYGPEEVVASLLQASRHVVVTSVQVSQVGVFGIQLQSFVDLTFCSHPSSRLNEALGPLYEVCSRMQFLLGSSRQGDQHEGHCRKASDDYSVYGKFFIMHL